MQNIYFDLSLFKNKLSKINIDDIASFQKGVEKLENLFVLYLLAIFREKNIFQIDEQIYSFDDIKKRLNILPKYERILVSLMDLFTRHGYIIELDHDIYEIVYKHSINSAQLHSSLKELISKYPKIKFNAYLLEKVVKSYLNVISGKKDFLSIIFPEGSFEIIEQIYKQNPDAIYYNKLMANIINYFIEYCSIEGHQPISIIELGAGIGSTTEQILPFLQDYKICHDYTYTDISKAFVKSAADNLGAAYHFMTFTTLNIDYPPDTQGFNKKYNIVIASNILHATKNIITTLKHIKTLLKPSGLLILNEGIAKKDFSTLAYGLLDGWWAFNDDKWRVNGTPFVNFDNWATLLALSGFQRVESINQLIKPKIQLYQDVIIAFYLK